MAKQCITRNTTPFPHSLDCVNPNVHCSGEVTELFESLAGRGATYCLDSSKTGLAPTELIANLLWRGYSGRLKAIKEMKISDASIMKHNDVDPHAPPA